MSLMNRCHADIPIPSCALTVDFHAELTRGFHLELTHGVMRAV